MSTPHNFTTAVQHPPQRRRRRRHRPSRRRRHHPQHTFFTTEQPPLPTTTATTGSSSFGVSDSDDRIDSECGSSGIFSYNHNSSSRRMESSSSDGDDDDDDEEEIDLECGELEMKVHFSSGRKKEKKICRICHLNFDGGVTVDSDGGGGGGGDDGGGEIQLGCNCKGDLGTSHKQCAETWFKIKGNLTCEICGVIAQNVGADQTSEIHHMTIEMEPADRAATTSMAVPTEQRTFWQGRRIMNILLGCMVFAFIISWLFHFNVLP